MDYILSFGMILFGIIAMLAIIFKYTKDEHEKENFSSGSSDLFGVIFSFVMENFPWWLAKMVLIFISLGIIFVGVLMFLTI